MYGGYGPGWGSMWGMGWLVPVVLLIAFMFLFIRRRHGEPRGDRSLEILRERYARGEITKEDFDKMKRDLT